MERAVEEAAREAASEAEVAGGVSAMRRLVIRAAGARATKRAGMVRGQELYIFEKGHRRGFLGR
jgi:hypothetical protein